MHPPAAIYISSHRPLPVDVLMGASGIRCTEIDANAEHLRAALDSDYVYEVASTKGPRHEALTRRAERVALSQFLKSQEPEIRELLTIGPHREDSHQPRFNEEFYRRFLDQASLCDRSFSFESNVIYDLWPSHVPGPARLQEFWPPVRLTDANVGGIAPELFGYQRDFIGKTWVEVSDDRYACHDDVFNCMDLETLQHLFPGYLLYCHRESGSMTNQMLRFFAGRKEYMDLLALLRPQQQAFTMQAMDFIMR